MTTRQQSVLEEPPTRQSAIRKSALVWLALGAILIAAAIVLRFVVLPSISKLPSDLSSTQKYEGTMQTINPQALATGDLAHLLTPVMPITADHSVIVDAVDGDTAIVTSSTDIALPDGSKQNDVHTHAVSRDNYTPVKMSDEKCKSLVPQDKQDSFESHEGIDFSWPSNPPKDGTALFDPVTRTAQAAKYIDSSDLAGRKVYNYRVDAAGPIQSPTVLSKFSAFPAQLPTILIAGLLQAGLVPENSRGALAAALPTLPPTVATKFGSLNHVDAAVDQQLGAPVKVDQTQRLYVTIPVDGKDLAVLPLSTVSLHTASDEVTSAADSLSSAATVRGLVGVWLPLALTVAGLALGALGLLRLRRK